MKSLKCKNLFIVIIIYLLVTFFILSNIRIYKNIVDLVFWGCISIYLIYCIKNGYIRCKCDNRFFRYMILISCFYVIFYFGLGLIFGYAKSPYNHEIITIIKNFILQIVPIIGIEISKGVIIFKNKKIVVVLSFIVFTMLEINYYMLSDLFFYKESFAKYIFSTIFPLIAQNLLSIYLILEYSFNFPLIFKSITNSFFILSPILPNIDWYIEGSLGILVPFFIYLIFEYLLAKKKTRNKERKITKVTFILEFIFCICLVCFMKGIFKYEPIDILSNSMSPTFNRGDIVVFYKADEEELRNIPNNSIIVYEFENQNIAHRIIKVVNEDGEAVYQTKGDRNNVPDKELVKVNQIKGIYKFHFKYIGFPSIWLYEYFNS